MGHTELVYPEWQWDLYNTSREEPKDKLPEVMAFCVSRDLRVLAPAVSRRN